MLWGLISRASLQAWAPFLALGLLAALTAYGQIKHIQGEREGYRDAVADGRAEADRIAGSVGEIHREIEDKASGPAFYGRLRDGMLYLYGGVRGSDPAADDDLSSPAGSTVPDKSGYQQDSSGP